LSDILPKSPSTRCTACKRLKKTAVSEQADKEELCGLTDCMFVMEIAGEIERRKNFIDVRPIKKKVVTVVKKPESKIKILRKQS